jgi:hypothetical protein
VVAGDAVVVVMTTPAVSEWALALLQAGAPHTLCCGCAHWCCTQWALVTCTERSPRDE